MRNLHKNFRHTDIISRYLHDRKITYSKFNLVRLHKFGQFIKSPVQITLFDHQFLYIPDLFRCFLGAYFMAVLCDKDVVFDADADVCVFGGNGFYFFDEGVDFFYFVRCIIALGYHCSFNLFSNTNSAASSPLSL